MPLPLLLLPPRFLALQRCSVFLTGQVCSLADPFFAALLVFMPCQLRFSPRLPPAPRSPFPPSPPPLPPTFPTPPNANDSHSTSLMIMILIVIHVLICITIPIQSP